MDLLREYGFLSCLGRRHRIGLSLLVLCFLAFIMASTSVQAAGFALDVNVGHTAPSDSDFRGDAAADVSASMLAGRWTYRVGYTVLGELSLRDSLNDTYIDVSGAYLQFNHTLPFDWLDIDLGGGAFFARSEAFFGGNSVAKERDVRPFVEVRAIKPVSSLIAVQVGIRYFNDVIGSDLSLIHAGIRLNVGGDR